MNKTSLQQVRTLSGTVRGAENTAKSKSRAPLGREFAEKRNGVDHGSRLVRRRGKPVSKLVPEGDHMVGEVEAVVLEDRRDARDTV